MAEILVSPIFDTVIRNLASPALQEYQLQRGFNKELKKLSRTLERIRDVLDDAEEKQVKEKAVKSWLIELKGVAYDANDILEECAIEATLQSKEENQVRSSLSSCFCFKQFRFRNDIGSRIRAIRERIDEIAKERSQFDFRQRVAETQPPKTEHRQQTHSFIQESEVYGREEDKAAIVELLLTEEGSLKNLSIISIVGLGGLGKTTLAQLAYNDERVKEFFALRIWVCVSDTFDVEQLINSIIETIVGGKSDLTNIESKQRRLQELLSGKKFFLVLDDVWSDDPQKWENLKILLLCGSVGSKVLVSTRIEKVAVIMDCVAIYPLKGLSEIDCWALFKQRAFGEGREGHPNLVDIGKEIVKKCGGVPLAAKALGSLMRFKTEERDWLSVKDSEIWHLPEDKNAILPTLKLSYYHLSPHLRQCFAFCSIFPKDHIIKKEALIQLWMANNFIPSEESMELEDKGDEIFNELLWRSFFQDIQKDGDGNIIRCKMHDLVHDLARYIMGNECFNVDVSNAEKVSKKIRHLSLTQYSIKSSSTVNEALCGLQALHTFYLPSGYIVPLRIPSNISNYKCLRVLDLSWSDVKELPISVDNLKHLRYLDLSGTEIEALPESVSSLVNLQTLKLVDCYKLCKLPSGVRNMTGLRYLDISYCESVTHMPTRIGQLSCLKMLPWFIVGANDEGSNIGELRSLNYLRGNLEIRCLENARNGRDGKKPNLKDKPGLRSLELSWSYGHASTNNEVVLEALQPHCNIRRLVINNYGGIEFPYWMGDSSLLSNLVYIKLNNCERCQRLPSVGQLAALEVLDIDGLVCVRSVGNEFYGDDIARGFPKLKEFRLRNTPDFEEWSIVEGKEVFHVLRILEIENCPKLTRMPLRFPSLEKLKISKCHNLISLPLPEEEAMRGLSSLQKLEIRDCDKLEFLCGGLQYLIALEELYISGCPELVTLTKEGSSMGQLTALRSINIRSCRKLESLREIMHPLTALQTIRITDCPELEFLPKGMHHLTALQHLSIFGFQKLATLSDGLQYLIALENLYISGCPELVTLTKECSSMGQLTALRSIYIRACPKLESLPEIMHPLTALQTIHIADCPELESLPKGMHHLTALQDLYISRLQKLKSLSSDRDRDGLQHLSTLQNLQYLTAIKSLYVCDCPELVGLTNEGVGQLTALRSLYIHKCPKFESSLLEGMHHLTTLERLSIDSFRNLESLPEEGMRNLISLHQLTINKCDKLKSLPDALQRLTALQQLSIWYCPQLERRCKKETGEDWHKIAQVPLIRINGEDIRRESS